MKSPAWRRLGLTAPTPDEVELLRAAILDHDRAIAAWRRWLERHDVDSAPARAQLLLPAVSANLPEDADADRLRGLRRRTWMANHSKLTSLGHALDVLSPLPELPIVIKGAALTTVDERSCTTRSFFDLDIMVGSELFESAIGLLKSEGWSERAVDTQRQWSHAKTMADADGVEIDVHRWIAFPRFTSTFESGWFDRAIAHEVAGRPCRRLGDPDQLVLTVVHGLSRGSASSVQWPLDVAELIGDASLSVDAADLFWSDVVRSASEISVGVPLGRGLEFCRDELEMSIPQWVLDELACVPYRRAFRFEDWVRARSSIELHARVRKYIDVERLAGRRPTVRRYVGLRWGDLRERGVGSIVAARSSRLRSRMGGLRRRQRS